MRDKHSPKPRNQIAAITNKGTAVKPTDCIHKIFGGQKQDKENSYINKD